MFVILLDSLHYAKSSLILVLSRSFSIPSALLSMIGGPSRTSCDGVHFPVHRVFNGRNVGMASMCDCEFYNVIDHLVSWLVIYCLH